MKVYLFDHFACDCVSISVDSALCDHDDVEPLAGHVTRRLELGAQVFRPVGLWWPLGDEDVVSLADNPGNLQNRRYGLTINKGKICIVIM